MYVTMKNVCKPFKSKLSDVLCARYFFKEGIPALLCTEIYGKICGKKWRKRIAWTRWGGGVKIFLAAERRVKISPRIWRGSKFLTLLEKSFPPGGPLKKTAPVDVDSADTESMIWSRRMCAAGILISTATSWPKDLVDFEILTGNNFDHFPPGNNRKLYYCRSPLAWFSTGDFPVEFIVFTGVEASGVLSREVKSFYCTPWHARPPRLVKQHKKHKISKILVVTIGAYLF